MSHESINDVIGAIIQQMQGLGLANVHRTLPLDRDAQLEPERFVVGEGDAAYLNGWVVTWKTAKNDEEHGVNVDDWECSISIEGWRAYNFEAGQVEMNDWLQAVLSHLWGHVTLDDNAQNVSGVRLVHNEPRLSFDMLCHYARIDIGAELTF